MIIDADGHLFETEEVFAEYMEPSLRRYRPRLITDDEGSRFWVVDGATRYRRPHIPGAFIPGTAAPPGGALNNARRASVGSQTLANVKERLADLDREGIDIQFLFPSFLLEVNTWTDGGLGNGVCRAYNTWLAKACAAAPERLKGIGLVCLCDPESAAQELARIKQLGLAAVMVSGVVGSGRLDEPVNEIFFAEANRLRLPIAVHFNLQFPGVSDLFPHFFPTRVLAGLFPLMAGFTSVMCCGLLERYPNLRFAFLEGGCNWVAAFLERIEDHFESPRYNARQLIQRSPREFFNSGRIFFGCEGNEPFLAHVVDELGDDKLLFSSDYPHADRTEGTARMLQARADLTPSTKEKILAANARRFYGI